MSDKPDDDDGSFMLWGMKVRTSDILPNNGFGIQFGEAPPRWFGLDPAGPDGDYSVVRINPSFRIDKGLFDDLTDEQIAAADWVSIELRAMALAADLYEQRERALLGTTTASAWPEKGRSFCMADMEAILERMRRERHDMNVKLIESFIAAGMTVTVTDAADRPVVALPPEYKGALDEVLGNRDNRDPLENVYRDWGLWPSFPKDYLGESQP